MGMNYRLQQLGLRQTVRLQEFTPENELEHAIADTKEGVRQVADLMRIIARSNLFVSSKGEVQSDGSGFDPLLFEKDGHPFVAVFSSRSGCTAAWRSTCCK
jgi:hypothetical protein